MRCVSDHMSSHPHTVGAEQSVRHAGELMREHGIRHLPVLHGGQLVGVISDRDVRLIESISALDVDSVTVEEAMSPEPYTVEPRAKLASVVRHMAAHKLGSAVVVLGTRVQGVFTTTDAMRLLAERLDAE